MRKNADTQEINAALARTLEFITRLGSKNRAMRHCLELAQEACASRAPVLILGESGTGKSLIAQSLHYASPMQAEPCMIVDCLKIAPADFDTALFGIAFDREEVNRQDGAIARAGGGTLIIDSVDLLPLSTQSGLLHLLHSGYYRLVGGDRDHASRVRIVATSSADLAGRIAGGLFREDFHYTLGEVTLRIPPLRERAEDIPELVQSCIVSADRRYGKNVGSMSKTALEFLMRYRFPGNIRELNRIVNRAVLDIDRDVIYVEDLGLTVDQPAGSGGTGKDLLPLEEIEKNHIATVLAHADGSVRAAARILRVGEASLRRKMRVLGLEGEEKSRG